MLKSYGWVVGWVAHVIIVSAQSKELGFGVFVKPWSKSESKPLSQQAPKSNKSPPKKEKRRIWTLG